MFGVRSSVCSLFFLSVVWQCLGCHNVLEDKLIVCYPSGTKEWNCRLKSVTNTPTIITEQFLDHLNISCPSFKCVWDVTAESTTIFYVTGVRLEDILPGALNNITLKEELFVPHQNISCPAGSYIYKYENTFLNDTKLIQNLLIEDGRLKDIRPGAFKNLPNMKYLRINGNNISKIESDTFLNLTALITLDLQRNSISVMQNKSFVNLPNLNFLYVSNNKIRRISRGIFINVTTNHLILDNNQISYIEPGAFDGLRAKRFVGPEKTMHIYLRNNKLEEINPNVFKVEGLNQLKLTNNSISVLRLGDFANLPDLDYLELSMNKLKEIPEGVFNGSKIVYLNLAYNEISVIQKRAFWNMVYLQEIEISNNKLMAWDSDWFDGRSSPPIRLTVDVSDNHINFPEEFKISYRNKTCFLNLQIYCDIHIKY